MTAEQLPPSTVLVSLNEKRSLERMPSTISGLCAELKRVQQERDELRGTIERALQDLRNGWPEAALDVLARASGDI